MLLVLLNHMPLPLTQHELDELDCVHPKCKQVHDQLELGAACHPASPVLVVYHIDRGVLMIYCAECRFLFMEITVAP